MQGNTENQDVEGLAQGLDGTLRQQAEAISVFVDGRIERVIRPLAERVAALEPGTPGRAEASRAVREARSDTSAESAARAERAVADAEAASQSQSPEPQPAAQDNRSDVGLVARVEQLETGFKELRSVSVTAFASAKAARDDRAVLIALRWGFGAFVALILVYAGLVLFGGWSWSWSWSIGFAAVVGGITTGIVYGLMRHDGPSDETTASADAIVARWRQSLDDSEGSNDEAPDHNSGAARLRRHNSAHASASASVR